MSRETQKRARRLINQITPKLTPIGTGMILPNTSGDHVRGLKRDDPIDETDLVNKAYVDNIATRSEVDLFLTNNASDIATYKDLEIDVVTAAEETIAQAVTANSTT